MCLQTILVVWTVFNNLLFRDTHRVGRLCNSGFLIFVPIADRCTYFLLGQSEEQHQTDPYLCLVSFLPVLASMRRGRSKSRNTPTIRTPKLLSQNWTFSIINSNNNNYNHVFPSSQRPSQHYCQLWEDDLVFLGRQSTRTRPPVSGKYSNPKSHKARRGTKQGNTFFVLGSWRLPLFWQRRQAWHTRWLF